MFGRERSFGRNPLQRCADVCRHVAYRLTPRQPYPAETEASQWSRTPVSVPLILTAGCVLLAVAVWRIVRSALTAARPSRR